MDHNIWDKKSIIAGQSEELPWLDDVDAVLL